MEDISVKRAILLIALLAEQALFAYDPPSVATYIPVQNGVGTNTTIRGRANVAVVSNVAEVVFQDYTRMTTAAFGAGTNGAYLTTNDSRTALWQLSSNQSFGIDTIVTNITGVTTNANTNVIVASGAGFGGANGTYTYSSTFDDTIRFVNSIGLFLEASVSGTNDARMHGGSGYYYTNHIDVLNAVGTNWLASSQYLATNPPPTTAYGVTYVTNVSSYATNTIRLLNGTVVLNGIVFDGISAVTASPWTTTTNPATARAGLEIGFGTGPFLITNDSRTALWQLSSNQSFGIDTVSTNISGYSTNQIITTNQLIWSIVVTNAGASSANGTYTNANGVPITNLGGIYSSLVEDGQFTNSTGDYLSGGELTLGIQWWFIQGTVLSGVRYGSTNNNPFSAWTILYVYGTNPIPNVSIGNFSSSYTTNTSITTNVSSYATNTIRLKNGQVILNDIVFDGSGATSGVSAATVYNILASSNLVDVPTFEATNTAQRATNTIFRDADAALTANLTTVSNLAATNMFDIVSATNVLKGQLTTVSNQVATNDINFQAYTSAIPAQVGSQISTYNYVSAASTIQGVVAGNGARGVTNASSLAVAVLFGGSGDYLKSDGQRGTPAGGAGTIYSNFNTALVAGEVSGSQIGTNVTALEAKIIASTNALPTLIGTNGIIDYANGNNLYVGLYTNGANPGQVQSYTAAGIVWTNAAVGTLPAGVLTNGYANPEFTGILTSAVIHAGGLLLGQPIPASALDSTVALKTDVTAATNALPTLIGTNGIIDYTNGGNLYVGIYTNSATPGQVQAYTPAGVTWTNAVYLNELPVLVGTNGIIGYSGGTNLYVGLYTNGANPGQVQSYTAAGIVWTNAAVGTLPDGVLTNNYVGATLSNAVLEGTTEFDTVNASLVLSSNSLPISSLSTNGASAGYAPIYTGSNILWMAAGSVLPEGTLTNGYTNPSFNGILSSESISAGSIFVGQPIPLASLDTNLATKSDISMATNSLPILVATNGLYGYGAGGNIYVGIYTNSATPGQVQAYTAAGIVWTNASGGSGTTYSNSTAQAGIISGSTIGSNLLAYAPITNPAFQGTVSFDTVNANLVLASNSLPINSLATNGSTIGYVPTYTGSNVSWMAGGGTNVGGSGTFDYNALSNAPSTNLNYSAITNPPADDVGTFDYNALSNAPAIPTTNGFLRATNDTGYGMILKSTNGAPSSVPSVTFGNVYGDVGIYSFDLDPIGEGFIASSNGLVFYRTNLYVIQTTAAGDVKRVAFSSEVPTTNSLLPQIGGVASNLTVNGEFNVSTANVANVYLNSNAIPIAALAASGATNSQIMGYDATAGVWKPTNAPVGGAGFSGSYGGTAKFNSLTVTNSQTNFGRLYIGSNWVDDADSALATEAIKVSNRGDSHVNLMFVSVTGYVNEIAWRQHPDITSDTATKGATVGIRGNGDMFASATDKIVFVDNDSPDGGNGMGHPEVFSFNVGTGNASVSNNIASASVTATNIISVGTNRAYVAGFLQTNLLGIPYQFQITSTNNSVFCDPDTWYDAGVYVWDSLYAGVSYKRYTNSTLSGFYILFDGAGDFGNPENTWLLFTDCNGDAGYAYSTNLTNWTTLVNAVVVTNWTGEASYVSNVPAISLITPATITPNQIRLGDAFTTGREQFWAQESFVMYGNDQASDPILYGIYSRSNQQTQFEIGNTNGLFAYTMLSSGDGVFFSAGRGTGQGGGFDFQIDGGGKVFGWSSNGNISFGKPIVSGNGVGLTNLGSWATFNLNVAQTTVATAATNAITNYTYSAVSGFTTNVNGSTTNLNAGFYDISFGAAIIGPSEADNVVVELFTNNTRCPVVSFSANMQTVALTETGFKTTILQLPANTKIELRAGSASEGPTTVDNVCLKLREIR